MFPSRSHLSNTNCFCIKCLKAYLTFIVWMFAIEMLSRIICWLRTGNWFFVILDLQRCWIRARLILLIFVPGAIGHPSWSLEPPTILLKLICGPLDASYSKLSIRCPCSLAKIVLIICFKLSRFLEHIRKMKF